MKDRIKMGQEDTLFLGNSYIFDLQGWSSLCAFKPHMTEGLVLCQKRILLYFVDSDPNTSRTNLKSACLYSPFLP